ncbi:MAG: hypothetical protein CVU56_21250 [Deltaproteobacteria bacterium HGW-Deltaproteobacteria-14]|jgi:hypothetical protein|nr:MAG: hypothetical protein CVU56_21250 [Deltaproteobacteria bacterium HGW-Deltaproteobacteria-14]
MIARAARTIVLSTLLAACGGGSGAGADGVADTVAAPDTEMSVDTEIAGADTAASTDDTAAVGTDVSEDVGASEVIAPPPGWPPPPPPGACARDAGAPFLDAALAPLGLTADGLVYDADQLSHSTKYWAGGLLDDAFLLSWQRPTLWAPTRATCFAAAAASRVDAIIAGPHPVSGLIRHAAALAERWEDGPPLPPGLAAGDLAAAIALACAAAGESCAPPPSGLPADLDHALVPVVLAIADGLAARRAMGQGAPAITGGWVRSGGLGSSVFAPYGALEDPAVRAYLAGGDGRRAALTLAAARIAHALEAVDWGAFRDREDVAAAAIPTPIGWLRVGGAGPDTWPADLGETWLLVDVGGDDTYLFDVGANTEPSRGVNVAVDLGGDDVYTYPEAAATEALPAVLPADADGRYAGDASYGPVTLSRHGRQGSGRHGIGMLLDLGGGADTYRSLSQSQGYAHLGVGVLYDDGGADTYASEQASQGDAAYGIGLLVDRGDGDDDYRLFSHGQGAGEPLGVGILFDEGGDDTYLAEVGAAELQTVLYFSPQMPGAANNSAAQGAGLGVRWDDHDVFLSGGLGILRDAGGDDRYTCGLFCQGSGFWQGTGLLSDAAGADRYDGLWYVQGGAAHYAIGVLLDGGPGDDGFNEVLTPVNVQLGCGHDFSLGLLVNEAGDDRYRFASLALGAGNCNGLGLFVDNAGADTFTTTAKASAGYASLGECASDADRPLARTVGVLLDAGGADTWSYPADEVSAPGDDTRWGRRQTGAATELGVGLDGTGETGLHAD